MMRRANALRRIYSSSSVESRLRGFPVFSRKIIGRTLVRAGCKFANPVLHVANNSSCNRELLLQIKLLNIRRNLYLFPVLGTSFATALWALETINLQYVLTVFGTSFRHDDFVGLSSEVTLDLKYLPKNEAMQPSTRFT